MNKKIFEHFLFSFDIKLLDDGIVNHHKLWMMFANMNSEVPFLLSPIGALGTLKHRFFSATLDLFMPSHGWLPSVSFPAMTACKQRIITITWTNLLVGQNFKFSHRMTIFSMLVKFCKWISQKFLQVWRYQNIIKFEKLWKKNIILV